MNIFISLRCLVESKVNMSMIIFILFSCLFHNSKQATTPSTRSTSNYYNNDIRQLNEKIQHLETEILSKLDELRNELVDRSRNIEINQHNTMRNAIDGCENNFKRYLDRSRRHQSPSPTILNHIDSQMNNKIDNLSNGMQLAVTTLGLLNWDVAEIKRNLSILSNITNSILYQSDIDRVFFRQSTIEETHPKNCAEIKRKNSHAKTDIYIIQPNSTDKPLMVFCEMEEQNGGWLLIQDRYEGQQDFYLGWEDYKVGFGNLAGDFWLGLENIYKLTGTQLNELLIEVMDTNHMKAFAHYDYFSIGSENEGYAIKVLSGYHGTAGDSLMYHAGSKFSTKDRDHDTWSEGSCAQSHKGGWWYKSCDKSNLNGRYLPGQLPEEFLYQSMYWGEFRGPQVGLLQARMMIRPRDKF